MGVPSANFSSESKTDTRKEEQKPPPGPGAYKVNMDYVMKRTPTFTPRKEVDKTFVDRIAKGKAQYPAVGQYDAVKLEKLSPQGTVLTTRSCAQTLARF